MQISRSSIMLEFDKVRENIQNNISDQDIHPVFLRDEIKNSYYSLMNNLDQTPHFRLNDSERFNITALCEQLITSLIKLTICGNYDSSMSITTNIHPENGERRSSLSELHVGYVQDLAEEPEEEAQQ